MMDSQQQHHRPGLSAARGEAFPASSPFTAPPRGPTRVPPTQQGQYIASLLQRHLIPELPVPGEDLAAYHTRDLLQSRSATLGRLSEGGAALSLAQTTLEWQLKNRTGMAWGLPRPTPTPPTTPSVTPVEAARAILSQEVAKNSSRGTLYEAHRRAMVARSEEAIAGRRRPHTVYHERPSQYSEKLNPTLASLSARQAASGAPGSVGEPLPGVTPRQDENPYLYLQYPDVAMDKDGVVTSPFRFTRAKRITVPVILTGAVAANRPATSGAVRQGQGRARRPTQLASWEAQKGGLLEGGASSASTASTSAGAAGSAATSGSSEGGPGVACGAYSVISNAGKLLDRFITESVQEAEATVKAAEKLGSVIARALRPATAPDTSTRRPLPPAHPGGAAEAAAGAKGGAAAGGGLPAAPTAPVPTLYTGGLLYGMNPLDRERQIVSLKDAILQAYAKKLKAGKAPPAAKKK